MTKMPNTKIDDAIKRACSAQTWVTPDEVVSCKYSSGHAGKHRAYGEFGLVRWHEPVCRFTISDSLGEFVWSVERTQDLVQRLQHQLKVLVPDTPITGDAVEGDRKGESPTMSEMSLAMVAAIKSHPSLGKWRYRHEDGTTVTVELAGQRRRTSRRKGT